MGQQVGYAVRFDDKSHRAVTRIRYVTDGVLLREAIADGPRALKERYSHIVIDEVHERSVNTDFLLGIIKEMLVTAPQPNKATPVIRSQLATKLIIMSATTDAERIATFFKNQSSLRVETLQIPGRTYDVKIMFATVPVPDYIEGAAAAADLVNTSKPLPGDVLVFLPGQEEIAAAVAAFKRLTKRNELTRKRTTICELYASQPPEDQRRALEPIPPPHDQTDRKVIFCTNVAETSITIPGIKYVVDSGMVKVRTNITYKGVTADVLRIQPVSRAEAEQRKGRAGRTSDGFMFNLYTEPEGRKLQAYPRPEILRVEASSTLLHIFALRHFSAKAANSDTKHAPMADKSMLPMMDSIPDASKVRAIEILLALQALTPDMALTRGGELMSRIPTTPMLARCLLESVRLGCLDSMLTLAAVLSVDGDIFIKPRQKIDEARAAHRRFFSQLGDHHTIINAFNAFSQVFGESRQIEFCRDHYLNRRILLSVTSVRLQLNSIMTNGDMTAWGLTNPLKSESLTEIQEAGVDDMVRRCIIAGFFTHVARKRPGSNKYVPISSASLAPNRDSVVDIHPSSFLRTQNVYPQLVIYNELVLTAKMYMRNVVSVEPHWLQLHSGGYLRVNFT